MIDNGDKKPCKMVQGGLYISNHGQLVPCFQSFHRISAGQSPYIDNTTVKEYFASGWLSTFNHNVNVNGYDVRCENCYQDESLGKLSFRQKTSDLFATDRPGQMIQLNLGNLCNNGCVTCNPYQSSKIAQEWQKLNLYSNSNFEGFTQSYDSELALHEKWWATNIDKLNRVLADVIELRPSRLSLIGGEPVVNPLTKTILRALHPVASDLEVHFTTNSRVFDSELVDILKTFKDYSVRISVDGYGEVNEFVRWPGTWAEFESTTALWDQDKIKFNIGLSAVTALNLDQLLVYLNDKNKPVEIWHLTDPSFLHCNRLPKTIVDQAVTKLKNLELNPQLSTIKQIAINHLSGLNFIDNVVFQNYIETICQSRNLNFDKIWKLLTDQTKPC